MKIVRSGWIAVGLGLMFVAQAQAQGARPAAPAPPAAAPQTQAPVSSTPDMTTADFGDWVVRCRHAPDPKTPDICAAQQTLEIEGKGAAAQIAIGRRGPANQLVVAVAAPPDVSFPSAVVMSIDDKDTAPVTLDWRQCLARGCFADALLKEDILFRWRKLSGSGQLKLKAADGRDIALPFSFRGLSQALDAMKIE